MICLVGRDPSAEFIPIKIETQEPAMVYYFLEQTRDRNTVNR